MQRWLAYTLMATVLWGIWGIVSALVSREASPLVTQVISTLGVVPAGLVFLLSPNWRSGANFKLGILLAALTGLFANAGNLCLLRAFSLEGPVSVVLPVSSMYPLVTALLALLFLRERLSRVQSAGFVVALTAIYIVSSAVPNAPDPEGIQHFHLGVLTQPWMFWAFAALVSWGTTSFFQKIATSHISNELCTAVFALASVPTAMVILLVEPSLSFRLSVKVWLLSLIFGVLLGVGSLLTFASYRWGKASVVTPIIALYPALTVLLSVPLLKEQLNALRVVAVVLALAAGVALSYEPKQPMSAER